MNDHSYSTVTGIRQSTLVMSLDAAIASEFPKVDRSCEGLFQLRLRGVLDRRVARLLSL